MLPDFSIRVDALHLHRALPEPTTDPHVPWCYPRGTQIFIPGFVSSPIPSASIARPDSYLLKLHRFFLKIIFYIYLYVRVSVLVHMHTKAHRQKSADD